ncbi:MAG: Peptidase family protein [Verrucomicrobiales bacterium]|nr:Peptidase family protein [Verrucomicrobiales bacterium]
MNASDLDSNRLDDILGSMRDESFSFLQTLLNTPSPVGHEGRGQRVWLDYVSAFAGETYSDAYGNCVATLNKGGLPKIMLAGHADEIGLTINYINEDGYIYVRKLGGMDPVAAKAQRVVIHTARGPVPGVIGNVPPHLTKVDGDRKLPKIEDLFVDIGVSSKSQAEKLVRIGDPITLDQQFARLREDLVIGRALDNRIGTFAVAETMRLLKGQALEAEICAVSTVQEEVGLLGARQIAYSLKPDIALIVDVTHATDYPTVSKAMHGDVKIGKGPTLTHGGCNHPSMVERLENLAAKENIPVQHEAMSATSGTDTDVVFWTRGGIPSALVSVPNRYMHSPVEMISLNDLEMVPRLLAAFAKSVTQGEQFKIKI